jgi:hypothetical protein
VAQCSSFYVLGEKDWSMSEEKRKLSSTEALIGRRPGMSPDELARLHKEREFKLSGQHRGMVRGGDLTPFYGNRDPHHSPDR